MNEKKWKIRFGLGLVILSAALYILHFFIFKDSHHISMFLLSDIAFIPLEVLIVSLIIHELLESRERRSKMQKLNMAIGVFFGEMGTDLIRKLQNFETTGQAKADCSVFSAAWDNKKFKEVKKQIKTLKNFKFDLKGENFDILKNFLLEKRPMLLSLLENPNLLEHEAFTDLLWATFHLTDELSHRSTFAGLPETDLDHLQIDLDRAFSHIVVEWISYMQHLKEDYPFLFSLALRTNPFKPECDAVVKK
ncbi:MAG: hypothetical protein ACYTFY_05665 [Planctomycetota bacterium]|jgi:hypothetical protein